MYKCLRCIPTLEHWNERKTYTGIDLCKPMVREAQVRTGCKIMQRDILRRTIPLADRYIASGSMNLLTRLETWSIQQNLKV